MFWAIGKSSFGIAHLLTGLAILIGGATASYSETRAVLVGVSDYLYLDADLRGPKNDVRLMAETLAARGMAPHNITVLSSDSQGFASGITVKTPTRDNILAALDYLSQITAPTDTAIFYFSGHGSQMPDTDGDEQGGYDQIFLPADARNWNSQVGAVENALTDDELRAKAQAIMANGATLVAILDACHSGTGFRALGGRGAARYIAPGSLGIPDLTDTINNSSNGLGPEVGSEDRIAAALPENTQNNYVYLYSSQSNQRSFEYPLGASDSPQAWYGEFTRALVRTLSQADTLSYRDWVQAARDEMRQASATASQVPDLEGPLVDQQVFGVSHETTAGNRIAIRQGKLTQGLLSGITKGSQVVLYADILAADPIGQATVSKVNATTAILSPVDTTDIPQSAYASVVIPGPPPALVFSMPAPVDEFDGYDYRPITEALQDIANSADAGEFHFDINDFGAGLYLMDGQLILTAADGIIDPDGPESSRRLDLDPAQDVLPQVYDWLSRAARISRFYTALGNTKTATGGFGLLGGGLKVVLERKPAKTPNAACSVKGTQPAIAVTDGGTVGHCDQLWLTLTNGSTKAQDVTVLYVDQFQELSALWPAPGLSNRIAIGESRKIGFLLVNPLFGQDAAPRSFEDLVVLSTPAEKNAPRSVLTALADTDQSRAAPTDGLQSYLFAAVDPDQNTRGFSLGAPVTPLSVSRFGFELLTYPETN